jgi:ABC-type Fe3+-hydroxamate transport system substrate-binding protein
MVFLPFFSLERGFPVKESNQISLQKETERFLRAELRPSAVAFVSRSTLVLLLLFSVFTTGNGWALPPDSSYPKRIISMSPGITEILFALGVGDRVVGVTDFCNYPDKAKKISKVGGLLNPNYETLITLKPDLIIHQPNSHKIETFVAKLEIRNLPISMFSLEEIFETIKTVGSATGSEEAADRLIRKMRGKIDFHRSRLAKVPRKSVLLLLGISNDSMRDIYGVGPKTHLGELLALSGGDNILDKSKAQYPKISKEFIISESPEIIIEAGPTRILTEKASIKRKQGWQQFPTITAVKNGDVYFIGSDYILVPGPRLVNIIDDFVRVIHPELFSSDSSSLQNAGGSLK